MLKQYLLVTMDNSQDEVDGFRESLRQHGKFIYPIKFKISDVIETWSNELLVYMKGTNLVKYRADIISFYQMSPTGNEIGFPKVLESSLDKYRSFLMLSSFQAVVPFSWNKLLNENQRPKKIVPRGAPHRVFANFPIN